MSGKLSVFFEIIYALVSIDATAVKSIVRASFGIKHRAVNYKLRTLMTQSYIENIGYGKYRKLTLSTRRKAA